ncbi:MAG: hypothetical protein MJ169_05720 [Treponema sp.]|nr:hypothetical protein [Treponema sp.]
MILQISSGQGPVECELAVRLLFEALQKEFYVHTFEIKSKNESRFCNGWSSVIFETSADLAFLERSQALNRKRALEKLELELKKRVSAEKSKLGEAAWNSSNGIVRGNPVRIYEGKNFKLIT